MRYSCTRLRFVHYSIMNMNTKLFRKTRHTLPVTVYRLLFGLLLLCLPGLLACAQPKEAAPISRSGFYFDTVITITVYEEEDAKALDTCFSLADRYEHLFSARLPESDVSRINAANQESVTVDPETVSLINTALFYADLSGGVFDPTIGALSSLWDFQSEEPQLPDPSAIKAALSTVDYRDVEVDEAASTIRLLRDGAAIDLGGIAKGYIADRMKEALLKEGVTSAIINLGGNVLVLGEKSDGTPYRVGIQYPFRPEGTAIETLDVKDRSLVSSGCYERYMTIDGVRYHHILDTETGWPVENDLLGVTILSEHSVDGDALSTICYALGLKDGLSLIESLPGTEAVFIKKDETLIPSSGLSL